MPANPDWTRWVFASVAAVLKQVAIDAGLPVLIEHLDERTENFMQAEDKAEVRVTGPFIQEPTQGSFRLDVDANVLLSSRYGGASKHGYDILRFAGFFAEAMSGPIPVWNYGDQPGDYADSPVFIGCLLPRNDTSDKGVRVFHFGQISTTDKLKQTVVDARFTMFL